MGGLAAPDAAGAVIAEHRFRPLHGAPYFRRGTAALRRNRRDKNGGTGNDPSSVHFLLLAHVPERLALRRIILTSTRPVKLDPKWGRTFGSSNATAGNPASGRLSSAGAPPNAPKSGKLQGPALTKSHVVLGKPTTASRQTVHAHAPPRQPDSPHSHMIQKPQRCASPHRRLALGCSRHQGGTTCVRRILLS